MTDRALFEAAGSLGFPRLPLRPAVSVIAGREAWERFTTNGTEEDLVAARIAVAAHLAAEAQEGDLCGFLAGGPPSACPAAEKAHRTGRCAFCGASLAGHRRHARYCGGRCRAAASRATAAARAGLLTDGVYRW